MQAECAADGTQLCCFHCSPLALPASPTLPTLPLPLPTNPTPSQVLRANKESILTVIEVFIHDPLYKWALTTTAANRRQHDAPGGAAADEVG